MVVGAALPAPRVVAVAGRAGGPWSAARPLSPSFDYASQPGVGLDAAGRPRVVWSVERVRGVVAVDDAPLDTTPPAVDATFPARLPATRDGVVALTVPVRCSEACEVLLEAGDRSAVRRTLAAGEAATLRLKVIDRRLLYPRSARKLRLRLFAADPSANEVHRASTFRVRVIRRPLRSFRVGPSHSFHMFSKRGDRLVGALVNSLIDGLAAHRIRSRAELIRRYQAGLRRIERLVPDDDLDTPVGDAIYEALLLPLAFAGYDAEAVVGS